MGFNYGLSYAQSQLGLHEDFRGELGGGLHVAFNFDFPFHEGIDVAESAAEHVDCVAVGNVEGDIGLADSSLADSALAVFEVDGPLFGRSSFLLENVQQVHEADLLAHILASRFELGLHRLEGRFNFEWHS